MFWRLRGSQILQRRLRTQLRACEAGRQESKPMRSMKTLHCCWAGRLRVPHHTGWTVITHHQDWFHKALTAGLRSRSERCCWWAVWDTSARFLPLTQEGIPGVGNDQVKWHPPPLWTKNRVSKLWPVAESSPESLFVQPMSWELLHILKYSSKKTTKRKKKFLDMFKCRGRIISMSVKFYWHKPSQRKHVTKSRVSILSMVAFAWWWQLRQGHAEL